MVAIAKDAGGIIRAISEVFVEELQNRPENEIPLAKRLVFSMVWSLCRKTIETVISVKVSWPLITTQQTKFE